MKVLESSFDKEGNAVKQNEAKKKLLNEQIKVQEDRVKTLSDMLDKSADKYGENSDKTLKWKQAVNDAEAELNELKNTLKELPSTIDIVSDKMKDMGDKVKNVGDGVKNFGTDMATHVSAPVVAGLGTAIKVTADFDSEMSKVAAVSGATGSDFDALREKAIEMGNETKFSATESAEAMEYMAMAGWKTDDMLNGISGVMDLAAASGEELGTTSDILTDGLTAFGLSAQDSSHFADVLAAASANANTNVSMLGESFQYCAPVAGSMGYSVEDVTTALGLMANSGIKASQGGTALRTLLTNMAKPTDQMAVAMAELGISLDDGEGNMLSLSEVLDQLREGFGDLKMSEEDLQSGLSNLNSEFEAGNLSEDEYNEAVASLTEQAYGAEGAMKAQYAAMLAGKTGMAGLLAVVGASDADYQTLSNAINGASQEMALLADGSIVPLNEALASGQEVIETYSGAADQMSSVMSDNAAGDMAILKSNLETLAISIGDLLMPTVREIVDGLQGLVQWLTSLDDNTKQMIIKIALIAAAIGPVLIVIGTIISSVGSIISVGGALLPILGAIGSFIVATVVPAIAAFASAALAAVPAIVAFIAPLLPFIAIAAAVVAAGVLIYQNWDTIKAYAAQLGAKIAEVWGNIKAKTSEVWNNVKTAVSNAWNNIKTSISNGINNAKNFVVNGWNTIKTTTTNLWNGIKTLISTTLSNIVSGVSSKLSSIKNFFSQLGSNVKDTVSSMWTNVKNAFTNGLTNIINNVKTKLENIKNMFVNLGKNALQWGKDLISNFISGIKSMASKLLESIISVIPEPIRAYIGFSEPDKGPLSNFHTYAPDMMQLYAKGIKDNANLVTDSIDSVATDISVGFNGNAEAAADTAGVSNAILGAINPEAIYAAVKQGASDADLTIDIDGRDLRRNLSGMGVQFA